MHSSFLTEVYEHGFRDLHWTEGETVHIVHGLYVGIEHGAWWLWACSQAFVSSNLLKPQLVGVGEKIVA